MQSLATSSGSEGAGPGCEEQQSPCVVGGPDNGCGTVTNLSTLLEERHS